MAKFGISKQPVALVLAMAVLVAAPLLGQDGGTALADVRAALALVGDRGVKVDAYGPSDVLHLVQTWFAEGWQRAPVLVLGLGFLLIVPPLLLVGLALRPRRGGFEVTRKLRPGETLAIAGGPTQFAATQPMTIDGFLEVEPSEPTAKLRRHRLHSDQVVRIGREDDNDLQLRLPTVHRYHAVIQHDAERGFEVTDLSGADGNGVIVNGRRVQNIRLRDGDQLMLGEVKLKFNLAS